jgi:hypothetical protein
MPQAAMKSEPPIATAAVIRFIAIKLQRLAVSGKRDNGSMDHKNLRNRNLTVTRPSQSISIQRVYE